MDSLKVLLVPFLEIFGICALILIVNAFKNQVLFKMGARNVPRRPANALLTVLGLMLAAMIFSASFATGDTLTHSVRNLAIDSLGETDIMIMREGTDFGAIQGHMLEGSERTNYFDQTEFDNVNDALSGLVDDGIIDGIAPVIIETVPVVAKSRLNEPAVTVLGFDHRYMTGFDRLLDDDGNELSLATLEERGDNYLYINSDLADAIEAGTDDEVDLFFGIDGTPFTIAGIYETGGNPSTFSFDSGATAVMTLSQLQTVRDSEGINFILITNQGGAIDGAKHTDAVMEVLEPILEGTGLKAEPVKQEALDDADEGGATFSTIFLVLGSFSMIAGILLIFLIFVMLAAERKQELGIARAIGTQREHIVRLFTFEGVLYALLASAVGSGLGLLVSWLGMTALDSAFKEMGFKIVFDYSISGLTISYTAGVIFTLLVVFISAWRVSNLNIICAIKDIPEPPRKDEEGIINLIRKFGFKGALFFIVFVVLLSISFNIPGMANSATGQPYGISIILIVLIAWIIWGRGLMFLQIEWAILRLIGPILAILFGALMAVVGIALTNWTPYSLGISLIIIGICLQARRFGFPDRPAFTMAGVGLLVFWLSPTDWHPRGEEMGGGFEMFILTGIMLVIAGVWIIMYNSDLLLRAIMSVFGRLRALTPMIKTAVSYPMASRFRTGMAVAMFALIIFTLVYMSSMMSSIRGLLDDTDRVTGSFHIRAEVNYNNPITDIEAALANADGVSPDDFEAIGAFGYIPATMRDASGDIDKNSSIEGTDSTTNDEEGNETEEWADLFLMGTNAEYTDNVTYDFQTMTEAYTSPSEVWKALTDNPSLAVISSELAPTKYTQMGDDGIDLVIGEGEFVMEDEVMPDNIYIEVQNPFTKEVAKLQVIGVVDPMSGPYAGLVTTSQEAVDALWGSPIDPTAYRFKVKPDRIDDIPEIAKNLEKSFVENGMNTEVMEEEFKDYMNIQEMFFNLMMAFMALGLIVGIAALGVISARSVVERRQQIGMLRAIGFRQGMIQFSFLLESSFVALLGIGLGVTLGAVTAWLFLGEAGIEGLKVIIPWDQIGIIAAAAYIASLFTTYVPAYQASRIYPAEALRYE